MFYEAIFQPSKSMNYNSDAKRLEGKKIAVQDGWIIKDGPFKGQDCFYIPNTTVGWIPKCDLKGLKPIAFARWKQIHNSLDFGK
jgi:hypothetical protein